MNTPLEPTQKPVHKLEAEYIGPAAERSLRESRAGVVLGQTSRGLFLRLDEENIVFTTQEPFRGPLTINISGPGSWLEIGYRGLSMEVIPEGMYFAHPGILFKVDEAESWRPPLPAAAVDEAMIRRKRVGAIVEILRDRLSSSPFCDYLCRLTDFRVECPHSDPLRVEGIDRIRRALRTGNLAGIMEGVRSLLGYGPGLTPSGDDVIAGMLLGLSRYPGEISAAQSNNPFPVAVKAGELIQKILPVAIHATTLLSRNILANAASGWADERLMYALDGIMTGAPDIETCASYLAMWGSSSGIDSLVGTTLAVWGE